MYIVYRISRISPPRIYHETCSRRLPFIEIVVCYIYVRMCVCWQQPSTTTTMATKKKRIEKEEQMTLEKLASSR